MTRGRFAVLTLLVVAIALFFAADASQYLELERIRARQAALDAAVAAHPWLSRGAFFLAYALVTALSLPGAALMTLVGGALFGLVGGALLVSFASTLGATGALLLSRYLLRDWVRARFGQRLAAIDRGVTQDGARYLFALRLVPLFPFFLVNLAMGLTALPVRTFWWVSQLGMLPGTLAYVNAGRELGALGSTNDLLSPGLVGAFMLLGLLPLLSRKLLQAYRTRQVYAGWRKPRRFDRNLIVIGAGSGGLVSAYIAAALKAKVTLIEKRRMGGDCLNTGCVPSKTLIRSARLAHQLKQAGRLGVSASGEVDFAAVMTRIRDVIDRIAPHDSVERYTAMGVDIVEGEARITSPWTVEVNGCVLSSRAMVIATGARPHVPAIPGIEQVAALTSDTVWTLRERPAQLLVLGGGPVGCELAQAFQRLGSAVTLVQRNARLLPKEDEAASAAVLDALRADGVEVRLHHSALRFVAAAGGDRQLICRDEVTGADVAIVFDQLLLALGRRATVEGFGAEALGLDLRDDGSLAADACLATRFPNILVAGDVTGPLQYTHVAAHQAWYAAVNGLLGGLRRFRVDYRVIPRATFTDPEVAHVGLTEHEARAQGIPFETTRFGLDALDRAIVDDATDGYIQVLTVPGKDRILGATLVGAHASELIVEYVSAMKHGLGLNRILGTLHVYPTLAEANKYVAGEWKRAHAPARALRWLARWHRWRRGPGEPERNA